MKRKDALNLIKVEYAKHGEMTAAAMRVYAESRVSFAACTDAMKAGMKIFNDGRNNDTRREDRSTR